MADPSNFVNFSDYLGLNDEAGQQMFARANADAGSLRDEATSAADAQHAAASGGSMEFEAAGERVRVAAQATGR